MEITVRELKPTEKHCPCGRKVSLAFAPTGRVYTAVRFRTVVDEKVVYNPLTGKVTTEVTEKKFPVQEWVRGTICSECQLDYSTVTTTHRDGSTSWKPRVILDPLPRWHTSVNPGYVREYQRVEAEVRPVHPKYKPAEGAGKIHFDPLTNQVFQEVTE